VYYTGASNIPGLVVYGQQNNIENVWFSDFYIGVVFNASLGSAVLNKVYTRISNSHYGIIWDGNATSSPNANDVYVKAYNATAGAGSIGLNFSSVCQSNIVMGMIENYETVIHGVPWRCSFIIGAEGETTFSNLTANTADGNNIIEMNSDNHVHIQVSGAEGNIIQSSYHGLITSKDTSLLLGGNTGIYSVYWDDLAVDRLVFRQIGVKNLFYIDSNGDIELPTAGRGIILTAPNTTQYRLTVQNDGTLLTTKLP